jgi:HTH-type transcriptional regulator/antitoxin HipB
MDYPLKTTEQLRQQLRSLRKKRGLTQAHLGALIGVTQARVVEIEANPGSVSLQQVMQVLHALGAGFVLRDLQADAAPDQGSGERQVSGTPARTPANVPPAKVKKGSW